jgi:hypothetical protein
MEFFNKRGVKIEKKEASLLVLMLFKNGIRTDSFVNYPKIHAANLIALGADSVALYCNHAGNNQCTKSFRESYTVFNKVDALNKALATHTNLIKGI